MDEKLPASLKPASGPHERTINFIGHSVVNGLAVTGLTLMHLYGSLGAEWAAGGILAVAGVWTFNTQKPGNGGPPGAGTAGLLGLAAWATAKAQHIRL